MEKRRTIQKDIFIILILFATAMTFVTAVFSTVLNVRNESVRLDENLQNIARTVSGSSAIKNALSGTGDESDLFEYLDFLSGTLSNTDIISVIGKDGVRKYHTNPALIGTAYDGTPPDFASRSPLYVTDDLGPSGRQRRAYAAIYDEKGDYLGFVLAVMLKENTNHIILNTVLTHLAAALIIVLLSVAVSRALAGEIKKRLRGYEPDIFSSMFSVRDDILESLDEGILAFDSCGKTLYINNSAKKILRSDDGTTAAPHLKLDDVLKSGEKIVGMPSASGDILCDVIPTGGGALCILRDRTEYTKMMEELSGAKYLAECMRSANHDFTNKLHVILGLIQMKEYEKASSYITGITTVSGPLISGIVKSIEEPSVAALLIGKYSRAAELEIDFVLKTGSSLKKSDVSIPACDLVTIIGNLIDNAFDAVSLASDSREVSVGIFTAPHALLITLDDTGQGMDEETRSRIFENGYSTKGENRGVGLYAVSQTVKKYGGTIEVDSDVGVGTSFTVTLRDGGGENV